MHSVWHVDGKLFLIRTLYRICQRENGRQVEVIYYMGEKECGNDRD
jgi:hypothetical protein